MQQNRTKSRKITASTPPTIMHKTAVPESPDRCSVCARADESTSPVVVEAGSAVVCAFVPVAPLSCLVVWTLPGLVLCSPTSRPMSMLVVKCEGVVGGARVSTSRLSLRNRSMARV
jgi:hypothetical protein